MSTERQADPPFVAWSHDGTERYGATALAAAELAYSQPGRGHKRGPVLVMARKLTDLGNPYTVPLCWWEPGWTGRAVGGRAGECVQ